jgi:hypothetical protein
MSTTKPLAKLPQSTDTLLFLISQELKIRKLFNGLHKAGIEECSFTPCLDRLILAEIGIEDVTDEVVEYYCDVMDKRSRKIKPNRESIMKQALKAYRELIAKSASQKDKKKE